jgi:hypothetical protein
VQQQGVELIITAFDFFSSQRLHSCNRLLTAHDDDLFAGKRTVDQLIHSLSSFRDVHAHHASLR